MFLAKVTGNVVATQKNNYLVGHKLLIVREINLDGSFISEEDMVAIDQVDSGIGDTVIAVQEGDAVQQILNDLNAPIHTMIIGVVDDIDLHE